ncbi:TPA: hypothetical protein DCL30_03415 [Candidatus Peribacteria bacterium]|nr:MAG: hypothetical protein A3J91_02345 [Candidatus Peribacteria bacterium RIFOXYC2_FULL_58_10]OGJ83743.1 MAG: hypothetical protein A2529_05310 [Candidatus Peribacteria bacterium RIFOXYD2_FULL_58_15]HAI98558.1 hypothetical protein [Candidatus Peribacteria bacterium]HAS34271.1 hypothetical protein [Candidatus Peribacteria bacterium]
MSSVMEQFGRGLDEAGDHTRNLLENALLLNISKEGFAFEKRIYEVLMFVPRMAVTAVKTGARAVGVGTLNTVKAAGKAVLSAPIVPVKTGKKLGEAL